MCPADMRFWVQSPVSSLNKQINLITYPHPTKKKRKKKKYGLYIEGTNYLHQPCLLFITRQDTAVRGLDLGASLPRLEP